MAQNPDDELRELFASLHQDQEVSADKALGTKLPDLEAAGDQAEAIFKQMPACDLDPAQRQGLAGKGFEAVQEICEEFAKGLARHKEMMQETHLSPGLFQATLAQGRAAGRLIKVGDLLSQGGDTGALLCAATADALCTRALGLVKDKAADQQVPGPTRSDLAIAFSEALRLDARRLERQQASKTTNEQAGAPLKTQITDAEEQAALSKLVSTFLSLVLKGLGNK